MHPVTLRGTSPGGAAEIGFWMDAAARGNGYMGEAARVVVDFGFSRSLSLARIEWRAIVGNVASARTARSLGFRYEGLVRRGLSDLRGRHDGWIAGILPTDDLAPQPWPVLPD
ncbi:GNAT family N-acetyltransferase [Microbacterium oleivorans]|uniref:GNAT family N-acetyltransferase n=1 Tax=Microbacterium oleivorans TaxID=273677 RepID=A0A7D5FA73_9MICO|nr:GNAT family protein [Microbacterium oleivorans]QLD12509.1 GNAT family N-acetyltransferase [Microbacterium oleivorans]